VINNGRICQRNWQKCLSIGNVRFEVSTLKCESKFAIDVNDGKEVRRKSLMNHCYYIVISQYKNPAL
jgi:hypothetical protein